MNKYSSRFGKLVLGAAIMAVFLFAAISFSPRSAYAQSGTIYNLFEYGLQQITGSPGPGTVQQPTFGATMTLGTNTNFSGIVQQLTGSSTVQSAVTVNAGSGGQFGQYLTTICTSASGASTVTYTFGTNFLPTATVAPTTGKSITVDWVSDGTSWHERGRSASAQ